MRVDKVLSLILFLLFTFKAPSALSQSSQTIHNTVLSATQANVIYTDIGGGFIEITFIGEFDFSSIGGNVESFAGTFTCHESDSPYLIDLDDPMVSHVWYELAISSFNIFGVSITPVSAHILLTDGKGVFNDGFYIQVDIDYRNGDGLRIPNTTYGLLTIGVNAGAFPGDVLTSTDIPKNLNTFASATNPPNLYSVVIDSFPDTPPEEESGSCFIEVVCKN